MFISSDVTVNVRLIYYVFRLTNIYKGQVSLLRQLQQYLLTEKYPLQKIFQQPVHHYQKALNCSGCRGTLTYKRPKDDNNSTNINNIKQNRKGQIIWFNPPFNLKTKRTIGELFLNLLDKKQHLKIVSKIIKSRAIALIIEMIWSYQKNFGKSKSAMEHQKLHGKLSEYAILTIQTVSAVL